MAYCQAGMAVAAHEYGIIVNRLMLDGNAVAWPSLMSLDEWCKTVPPAIQIERTEAYITTLLASSVGRLLGVEAAMGYPGRCSGQARLERGELAAAQRGSDRLTDRACYLAFLRLSDRDGGDTNVTVSRLWNRANELLRQERLRNRLVRLAGRLMEVREMYRAEIEKCIK